MKGVTISDDEKKSLETYYNMFTAELEEKAKSWAIY